MGDLTSSGMSIENRMRNQTMKKVGGWIFCFILLFPGVVLAQEAGIKAKKRIEVKSRYSLFLSLSSTFFPKSS